MHCIGDKATELNVKIESKSRKGLMDRPRELFSLPRVLEPKELYVNI